MKLTAVLILAEEGGYVALNPETGTTTQGETVEEAVANLKEATALYLSEFPLPAPGHPVVTMFSLPAWDQSDGSKGSNLLSPQTLKSAPTKPFSPMRASDPLPEPLLTAWHSEIFSATTQRHWVKPARKCIPLPKTRSKAIPSFLPDASRACSIETKTHLHANKNLFLNRHSARRECFAQA